MSKQGIIANTLIPAGYFDPMIRVIVVVTLNGTPNVIMDGLITRQQVAPGNDPGSSTFTVTGEDVSVAMDLIDFSGFPYPCLPPEGRVLIMIAKYAMFGIVPLIVPSILIDFPLPTDRIPPQQGTDFVYTNALASNVGYVFYITPGPAPGMNTAYWGPEIKTACRRRRSQLTWMRQPMWNRLTCVRWIGQDALPPLHSGSALGLYC